MSRRNNEQRGVKSIPHRCQIATEYARTDSEYESIWRNNDRNTRKVVLLFSDEAEAGTESQYYCLEGYNAPQ